MKVAIVVERFDARGGGVESAAYQLVRELVARGVRVTVVCREARVAAPAPAEIALLRVPRFWQPLRIAAFSRAAERATASGFDVVHGFARIRRQHVFRAGGGSHAAYLEAVYRAPRLQRALSPRHRAILAIEEAVFRDPAQRIECNARRGAEEIARRYGVAAARLRVVYNGVDVERFHPRRRAELRGATRASLGLAGPAALFVGGGFERKGLDRAIAALARGPRDAALLVAGRGSQARHRRLAERAGVAGRVRFLGVRDDVPALHAAADLFVLPTRYDPFANACLEAMASGLPVATTPVNGAAELIEHGKSGLVLEQDFAAAFRALADAPGLAAMGERAREIAERHTWSRHAEETLRLYAEVLG
jgi:UDP-glucose:(heptosyl)LPS alpha-1,3-glucosyltransferase